MIKVNKYLSTLLVIALFIGVSSCAKDDDSKTPATISKTEIKAYSFIVENSDWEREDTLAYSVRISSLTSDVINGGAVFVYLRSVDEILNDELVTEDWSVLPYLKTGFIPINGEESTITFTHHYELDKVSLMVYNDQSLAFPERIPGQDGDFPVPGDLEYIVVAISLTELLAGIGNDISYDDLSNLYNIIEIEL